MNGWIDSKIGMESMQEQVSGEAATINAEEVEFWKTNVPLQISKN